MGAPATKPQRIDYVWLALNVDNFHKKSKTKLVLLACAKVAKGKPTGWISNSVLMQIAGCSRTHVQTMKRELHEAGYVTFVHGRGRGKSTSFTLHTKELQDDQPEAIAERAASLAVYEAAIKGQPQLAHDEIKGQPQLPKRPTGVAEKVNSRVGPNTYNIINIEAAGAAGGASAPNVEVIRLWPNSHEGAAIAAALRAEFINSYGENTAKSWLKDYQFLVTEDAGYLLPVGSAFEKSRWPIQFPDFVQRHCVRVVAQ